MILKFTKENDKYETVFYSITFVVICLDFMSTRHNLAVNTIYLV